MLRPVPFALVALVVLAGCSDTSPEPVAAATGLTAPTWVMTGPGGQFSLADAAGRPVVLQFGSVTESDWNALQAAHLDLEAAGALVVGAVTDGSPSSLRLPFAAVADSAGLVAKSYGYTGQPLVVVIDAEGRLRARAERVTTTEQFFALANGPLLEAEDVEAPLAPASVTIEPVTITADEVDALVREGAALLDLRSEEDVQRDGPIPFALVCPLDEFSSEVLPMNALVPVILAGPGAEDIAPDVLEWGYRAVYTVEDSNDLIDPDADMLTLPEPEPPASRLPVRRRAIG